MSRVGKSPIILPEGVTVKISNGVFEAQGKRGKELVEISNHVDVVIDGGQINVSAKSDSKQARMFWGTTQRLITSAVGSVSTGYTTGLELSGVGYRASVQGTNLVLQLGYSHDVVYPIPQGISVVCEKPTSIKITGPKQKIGQIAAEIRSYRSPEPYKGKGVIRADSNGVLEFVVRKEGKKK